MKARIASHFRRSRLVVAAFGLTLFAGVLQAAPAKRAAPGGLVLPPVQRLAAEGSGATAGTAVQCVDIRTGASFEYRAQHLLSSGAIEEGWVPDTAACCLGSPEGIRDHIVPDGAGGTYAAWVDSRFDEPDIYLQRFTACGDTAPGWPHGGRAVSAARLSQYNLDACSDGQGGVLLCWQDFRDGRGSTVYVQRMTANGAPAPGWPAGGMAAAPGASEQAAPRIAPDGAGGGLVFWQERDSVGLGLRVQRVSGDGTISVGWPPAAALPVPGSQHVTWLSIRDVVSGCVMIAWQSAADPSGARLQLARLEIGSAPGTDWVATAMTLASGAGMISEAALVRATDGGLLVGWSEMDAGASAVKLVRLTAGGSLAPGWPATGATITSLGASHSAPAVLPDGAGGAIVAWEDWRSTGSGEIYAQHVLGDGARDSLWTAGGVPVATGAPAKFAPMLAADGSGGAIVTWSEATSQAVAGYLEARRAMVEGMPQLLRTETNAGYARLVWTVGSTWGATVRSHRSTGDGTWEPLPDPALDDSLHLVLEDRDAPRGRDVEYRLSVETAGGQFFLAPVRVMIPRDPTQLVLERAWTAPGRDAIQIAFALPPGPPARVQIFDLMGRQVGDASLGEFRPGYHSHRVLFRGRAVSGIYFVRLSQGGRTVSRRLSFLR